MLEGHLSRKAFLKSAVLSAAAAALPARALASAQTVSAEITIDDLKAFTKLSGLSFSDDELKETLQDIKDYLDGYKEIRGLPIPFEVEPPTVFTPKSHREITAKPGATMRTGVFRYPVEERKNWGITVDGPGINNEENIAFSSVIELSERVRSGDLSPVKLTEIYLDRLRKYGDKLQCVVTLMPEQAMERARQAEKEIKAGKYRGPLHGIPCGIKDLFAMKGAKTTWGATPYKDQVLDYDCAVVEKLHAAGAIILAKLTLGALAMNDVWFGGKTKNPWNPSEGSSGSSAGSSAATAAGLVAFAIGTETLGSIMSPSLRCRVTGFRPTYGRISRYGAMGLSYTMDKVGPICREVEDCALIFAALQGHDPRDRSSVDRPFHYGETDVKKLKVGVFIPPPQGKNPVPDDTLTPALAKLGIKARSLKLDPIPLAILSVLEVEASASFDGLTRSDRIHLLKENGWPETFRAARFVPGVEYLQAQRARAWLMDKFEEELGDLDVVATLGFGGQLLRITNLTGHPQVIIPQGVDAKGASRSVSFVGRIYEEDKMLAVAHGFQESGNFHRLRPDLSKV